jgi:hypothetical protein
MVPEGVETAQQATWVAEHAWDTGVCVLLILVGLALFFFAFRTGSSEGQPSGSALGISVGVLASSAAVAFAGRDMSWVSNDHPAGHERLIQLFIYNYGRPFPDYLDFRPVLSGFAVVCFAMVVAVGVVKLRRIAVYGLLATTFWFSAWALNVYLIDLSPHWGQRELMKRYYESRQSEQEPLIAWQMNWKGENVYTGNRVHVFVQLDNKALNEWMDKHKQSTAYFVLEHSRLSNFKRVMGKRNVEELSTVRDNNKFILVRANI